MSEEGDGKPGPKTRIHPEDVLEVFEDREDRAEPLNSREIGDALGCSRRTAARKLAELEDAGELATKKPGGRARVYWVPDRPGAE